MRIILLRQTRLLQHILPDQIDSGLAYSGRGIRETRFECLSDGTESEDVRIDLDDGGEALESFGAESNGGEVHTAQ
jgi:hypothetical protein